jgi:hypothetical protein
VGINRVATKKRGKAEPPMIGAKKIYGQTASRQKEISRNLDLERGQV